MDTLREALSTTYWYDAASDAWNYTWTLDPDESCFSPENKDIKYGCVMRRVMDIEARTMYLLMGSEYTLISKVPGSLGSYAKLALGASLAADADAALTEART